MLTQTLQAEGYQVFEARDGVEALELYRKNWIDLILTDLQMPEMDGLELLRNLKEEGSLVDVIIMTAYGTIEKAVEAMKIGALDFITKPFDTDYLLILVGRALKNRRMVRENMLLRETFSKEYGMPEIIGRSPAIQNVAEKIRKVAATESSVLLQGESGTGKELFARAVHQLSDRKDSNFVAINCAAIPSELLESELFGYEKGAFTGADRRKIGYFELAHRGTLFLDEIVELPLSLQSKLLRVLQEKSLQRLGGTQTIRIDVRILSAANLDIEECLRQKRFREDLYYRLAVVPIVIPPLRERAEDVPLLVDHLLKKYEKELNKKGLRVEEDAVAELCRQEWRGNVRELENCVERGAILCPGNKIGLEDMGIIPSRKKSGPSASFPAGRSLQEISAEAASCAERKVILAALLENEWNKTRVAEQLKVSYKTLLTKIKDYDLEKERAG